MDSDSDDDADDEAEAEPRSVFATEESDDASQGSSFVDGQEASSRSDGDGSVPPLDSDDSSDESSAPPELIDRQFDSSSASESE